MEYLNYIAIAALIAFFVHQLYWRTMHLYRVKDKNAKEIYYKKVHGWLSWVLLLTSVLLFYLAKQ